MNTASINDVWSPYQPVSIKRRIKEFIIEKNMTINAFYERHADELLISKATFYAMVDGERVLYLNDLSRIAVALNMTVDRLTGKDNQADRDKLHTMVELGNRLTDCINLSERLLKGSVSATEKYDVLIDYGKAFYELKRYEEAHSVFTNANLTAAFLMERFHDDDRLFTSIKWLAQTSRRLKRYEGFEERLLEAERYFSQDVKKLGQILHLKAINYLLQGNMLAARRLYLDALETYRHGGDRIREGVVLFDLGNLALRQQNYNEAKELILESMTYPVPNRIRRLLMTKDLVITLYHRGEFEECKSRVVEALTELDQEDHHELRGKFYLLLSFLDNNPVQAEQALSLSLPNELRYEIVTWLRNHYLGAQQFEKAVVYNKMANGIPHTLFMDKEGF